MLSLTKDEIVFLIKARLHHLQETCGMNLQEAAADELMQKLAAERARLESVAAKVAEAAEFEAKHAAEMDRLNKAYPVKDGDRAEVTIGKRTYLAEVKSVSGGICEPWHRRNLNTRYLCLVILTKSGQPSKSMNDPHNGTWYGAVRPESIKKVDA
jgi:hypothetical protein